MSEKIIQLVKGIKIPLDAATQKLAFLGRSSSGKSYASMKFVEELLTHQVQTVILDPVGIWYSLRLRADGKTQAFPIPVFGGEYADVPLEPTSGELVAQLVVEKGISCVLDVSYMRKAERKRFVADFAENLFFLKKKHRSAMHLVVEEAQTFAPQKVFNGEERMLGAMEDIVKIGRNYGIGISLISQRPQSINKDCLNQTEALFCFQTNGTHERKAIVDWIVEKGLSKQDIEGDLSGLQTGTCFLWSPQWLKILKKVEILKKQTLDIGKTPEVGKISQSRTLAPVDLEKIKQSMQSVIQQKKENDPAELKREIANLKKQLSAKPNNAPQNNSDVLKFQNEIKELNSAKAKIVSSLIFFERKGKLIKEQIQKLTESTAEIFGLAADTLAIIQSKKENVELAKKFPEKTFIVQNAVSGKTDALATIEGKLPRCEKAILAVLAQRNGEFTSKTQAAILSGYSHNSGGFNNALGALRSAQLITGTSNAICITEMGMQAIGSDYEQLPTGVDLHNYWLNKLPKCERTILQVLLNVYPRSMDKISLGENSEYSPNSGGFNNALGKLRTLELIEGKGEIKASENLF